MFYQNFLSICIRTLAAVRSKLVFDLSGPGSIPSPDLKCRPNFIQKGYTTDCIAVPLYFSPLATKVLQKVSMKYL